MWLVLDEAPIKVTIILMKPRKQEKQITRENYSMFKEKSGMTFDEFYSAHYTKLLRWMTSYVKDNEMAHDMTNEAFIKALENIEKYSPSYKFTTWMYTITKNLARDHFKRQKSLRHISIDQTYGPGSGTDSQMTLADTLAYEVEDIESEDSMNVQKADIIKEMICQLDPKYREILTLREINGLSYEEIHMTLNLNPSTAKSRIRQGRLKLQQMAQAKFSMMDQQDSRVDFNWTY